MRLALAITWLIILAFAMLTPGEKFPEVDLFNLQDKVIHLAVFIVQAYLWCGIGVRSNDQSIRNPRVLLNFLLFGIVIGGLFEFAQLYIPNRSFDWMDLIVNAIGGILGLLVYLKWPSIKFVLD